MQPLYNQQARKKATNLSVNSDLLTKSRALKINLSQTLEEALAEKLKRIEEKKWLKNNKLAIKAYNEFVEEHGCFSDDYRKF